MGDFGVVWAFAAGAVGVPDGFDVSFGWFRSFSGRLSESQGKPTIRHGWPGIGFSVRAAAL